MDAFTGESLAQQLISFILMYKVFWWALWPHDAISVMDDDDSAYKLTANDKQLQVSGWFLTFLLSFSLYFVFVIAFLPESEVGVIFLNVLTSSLASWIVIKQLAKRGSFGKK